MLVAQQLGLHRTPLVGRAGAGMFLAEADDGVAGKQHHQQEPRTDAGEEQPAKRLFGRDRVEDHRDRRRQQDAERAAGGDDAGGEPAGIAALAHFRNAGRADRRAGRRRRAGHRGKQGAGEDVGDGEAARHLVHPDMQGGIEILAGPRLADRRTLEDEQGDRQQGDRGHFLVDVLGDHVERGRRHEPHHEDQGDGAEREGDRHAGEHHAERGPGIEQADIERAHRAALRSSPAAIWANSCRVSSAMPIIITE